MKKNPVVDAILSISPAELAQVVRAVPDDLLADIAHKLPPDALYEAYRRVHMTPSDEQRTTETKSSRGRPKGSKNKPATNGAATNGATVEVDDKQLMVPCTEETTEESAGAKEEDVSKEDFDPLAGELLKDFVWKLLYTAEKEEVGALIKKCMKLKISGVTEDYLRQLIGGWTTQGSLRAQQKGGATYYLLSIGAIKEVEEERKRGEAASA